MEVEGWNPPLAHTIFLDELKSAGYEGTELGPYGYLPTDPSVLREQIEDRSLALTSAFVPLRLKEPNLPLDEVVRVGELLSALGARYLVLSDALSPEREAVAGRVEENAVRLSDSDWVRVAGNIARVSELAHGFHLRCVFHHHVGSYIESPAEVSRLMETSGIGLCLDTGHYVYGGGDPVEAVKALGRRIEYVHLKDVDSARLQRARRDKLNFLDGVRAGVFCPLGAGCVRFPDLLRELRGSGYDGWMVVEQDVDASGGNTETPLECARASREYLRSALGV
jgi:inosose dehydratase